MQEQARFPEGGAVAAGPLREAPAGSPSLAANPENGWPQEAPVGRRGGGPRVHLSGGTGRAPERGERRTDRRGFCLRAAPGGDGGGSVEAWRHLQRRRAAFGDEPRRR